MKKGDVMIVADDDDDEVRNGASKNRATATLCTEEVFLRTSVYTYSSLLISAEMWGGGQDVQCRAVNYGLVVFLCKGPRVLLNLFWA